MELNVKKTQNFSLENNCRLHKKNSMKQFHFIRNCLCWKNTIQNKKFLSHCILASKEYTYAYSSTLILQMFHSQYLYKSKLLWTMQYTEHSILGFQQFPTSNYLGLDNKTILLNLRTLKAKDHKCFQTKILGETFFKLTFYPPAYEHWEGWCSNYPTKVAVLN